jgi:hypothetical protein
VDERQVRVQKAVAMGADDVRAVQLRQIMHRMFQGQRPHVFGRRIDQVAGQRLAGGDAFQPRGVQVGWGFKPRLRCRLGAVAREAVAVRTGSPARFRGHWSSGQASTLVGASGSLAMAAPMAKRTCAQRAESPVPISTNVGLTAVAGMAQHWPRPPLNP